MQYEKLQRIENMCKKHDISVKFKDDAVSIRNGEFISDFDLAEKVVDEINSVRKRTMPAIHDDKTSSNIANQVKSLVKTMLSDQFKDNVEIARLVDEVIKLRAEAIVKDERYITMMKNNKVLTGKVAQLESDLTAYRKTP